MTYHAQPLHVASNMAGEDAPMSDATWSAHRRLLRRFEMSADTNVEVRKEKQRPAANSSQVQQKKVLASR